MNSLAGFFRMYAGSVEALRRAAMTGDAEAAYRLGRMYEAGLRVGRDDALAAMWHGMAADRGHAEAQFRLGRMYYEGRGVARDSRKAVRWLRLAVERGVAEARPLLEQVEIEAAAEAEAGWRGHRAETRAESGQAAPQRRSLPLSYAFLCMFLAFMIFFVSDRHDRDRRSPPQNPPTTARTERPGFSGTAEHYLALAEKGDLEAVAYLGLLYSRGDEGLPQDDEQAVVWYRKGAERGHARSQYRLGWKYEHGEGVPKDEEEALRWYRKAAEGGYAEASYRLGWKCEHGQGVPLDEDQAIEWYRQAAAQGLRLAGGRLWKLEQRPAGR